jgi:uncharacterized protein YecA (UPF0149 family)
MGAIAEAIVAFAQPLIDQTDGSVSQMNQAMTMSQLCWNLALVPEDERETAIDKMKLEVNMTDEEFADFRENLLLPMIRRHCEMFPRLHNRSPWILDEPDATPPPARKSRGMERYAPCPCGSGRKYKFCCGAKK